MRGPAAAQLIAKDVSLTVGQTAMLNFRLDAAGNASIGAGEAAMPGNRAPSESQVIGGDSIEDLPLNGRDPSSLVYLSAGVTDETISQAVFPAAFRNRASRLERSQVRPPAAAGKGARGICWTACQTWIRQLCWVLRFRTPMRRRSFG